MTDEELDALVVCLRELAMYYEVATEAESAITTLRAQLAEARAERDVWEIDAKRNHQAAEIEFARAEQAEASLAAQIEVDAEIALSHCYAIMSATDADARATMIHCAIRNQPHDRTALDRMLAEAREKALREAAAICKADFDCKKSLGVGVEPQHEAILALIEAPAAKTAV